MPIELFRSDAIPSESTIEGKILLKLKGLGISGVKIKDKLTGPLVTGYPLALSTSTPISKITSKDEDIALALGVESIDIRRVKGELVIFVPNENRKIVDFKDALFWYLKDETVDKMTVPILLGMDFQGNNAAIDLALQPHILIAGSTGSGKAQPIDEIVITPNGEELIGNLQIGDFVIGRNGKPTKVIGIFPQGIKKIVKLKFNDGTSTRCCLDHLWKVQSRANRAWTKQKTIKNKWEVLSTRKIIDDLQIKYRINSYRNYKIPVISSFVKFNSQPCSVDPYLLGVLLGDGGLANPSAVYLTSSNKFIVKQVESKLPDGMCLTYSTTRANGITKVTNYLYRIVNIRSSKILPNTLREKLNNLNLLGKLSYDKFIPDCYKYNTFEVRLAILRGLMDTDGTVSETGSSIFNSSSKRLIDDVTFVVNSLGGTVKTTSKIPTYRDRWNNKVNGAQHWTSYICLPPDINPFLLPRKANCVVPKTKYKPTRYIDSFEYLEDTECICISVENDDCLYLTNNCIVTHNSIYESAIISALVMKMSPEKLDLYIVDPKRVDLTLFDRLPHVKRLVKDAIEWEDLINYLYQEVQNRNTFLERHNLRNIIEYNAKFPEKPMKFKVLIIDELADLIEKAKFEDINVINGLKRLIQVCRAAGVYVIACTQRTTVDVISGTVKANFPTRIALRLPTKTDSRTILDENGAENLLGNGDMLLKSAHSDGLLRYHAPYVKISDIKTILSQQETIKEALGVM